MFIQVENGMARHQHTITPTEGTRLMKAFYVSIIVYNVSLCSAKVSHLISNDLLCLEPVLIEL